MSELAKISKVSKAKMEHFLGSLPAESGVYLDEKNDQVEVDKDRFVTNLKDIGPRFKLFFKDPDKYLQMVPGNNFEKIENYRSNIKQVIKPLIAGDEMPLEDVAKLLGLKQQDAKDLLLYSQKKADVGLKIKRKKVRANPDKLKENLQPFVGSMLKELVTKYV